MASTSTRKRVDLSASDKRKICEVHEAHPGLKHEDLAQYMVDQHRFKLVDRTTISKILRAREKWLNVDTNLRGGSVRRARVGKWPQLEEALVLWFGQVRARRGVVTDDVIMHKAEELRDSFGISGTDFKLSHGWLQNFKTRHAIKCCYLHGESEDADAIGVELATAKIPFILKKYDPEDVFNFDETGLYYRASPCKTSKIGKAKGNKIKKDRITLGLCTNISGKERLKLVFIHKLAHPRCFPRKFDPNSTVHYYFNSSAWMNGEVFTHWVKSENRQMALKDRKICIIMDNARSHDIHGEVKKVIDGFDAFVLSHITILFLPPNVPSIVQPLDQGVIVAFKMCYKRKLVAWTLQQTDSNSVDDLGKLTVDVFQAMLWCVAAWHEVDDQTIRNCWRKSAILPAEWNADVNNLHEHMKTKMEEATLELGNLIAALNLGFDAQGKPLEKLSPLEYVNMEGEDDFEVEYSTKELVQFVQDGQEVHDRLEVDPLIDDSNDVESKVVKLSDAQKYVKDVLNFMASQGSQIFNTVELLGMEKIHDKLIRFGVAHLTSMSTKECDMRSFFASSEKSSSDLNDTL